ncbi:hypothetical protein [Cellulosimicrobium arenosum]|uniref:Uncharacterized protein n=1 Tax=Cellulosimicrobium arenosum TaxID=2708133 RepID=A0A927J1W7_9MICO|nr:hypothetical protein [Cellulosimicrobium arenosum]MBD8080378.1 hypothetical protein [Cellulosimicrobium arenosum]
MARFSLARPHVLVVVGSDGRAAGSVVESALLGRGWPLARSPADADLLVVAGSPGAELAAAVELLWAQVPAPRSRVHVATSSDVEASLDAAARHLRAWEAQRSDDGPDDPWAGQGPGTGGHQHAGNDGSESGDGHGGHSHDGMDVAGLPMASSAPDRDGLDLEALRVKLGPWLPGWPNGLVVEASMQGDVLSDVAVHWVDDAHPGTVGPQENALDALVRLLTLTGPAPTLRRWRETRAAVRQQRPGAVAQAARSAHRLARSRVLAWSLGGGPALAGGNAADVLHRWCDVLSGGSPAGGRDLVVDPQELATALQGADLAGARLAVASVVVGPGRTPAHGEGEDGDAHVGHAGGHHGGGHG